MMTQFRVRNKSQRSRAGCLVLLIWLLALFPSELRLVMGQSSVDANDTPANEKHALTTEQQTELETAIDGRDHREQAFYALIEHARIWLHEHDGRLGDAPVRILPDWPTIEQEPARYRGQYVRVEGRLEQQSTLDPPAHDFRGVFLRDDTGRVILIFAPTVIVQDIADGARMSVVGRFYKLSSYIARDGEQRTYPALVTAHVHAPTSMDTADTSLSFLAIVAALLVLLLIVFAAVIMYVRRQRTRYRQHFTSGATAIHEVLDEPTDLPDDPAAAMEILHQHAARHDDR